MAIKRLTPLPCPFCGSDEFVQSYHNGWDLWSVSCATCKVTMEQEGGGWVKEKDAINTWNTRNGKLLPSKQ
jgi:Lar family restriction alleviation protein